MTAIVSSGEGRPHARRQPLGRGALGVSLGVHTAALAALFWVVPALEDPPVIYEVMDIDMVAMADEPVEQLIVETPDDPPPTPAEEAPAIDPDPEPEPDSVDNPPPAEEPPPPVEPEAISPTETPDEGEDEVTLRIESFRRDYPDYYANINNQIRRCFRWEGTGRLEVVMTFRILSDGTTEEMDVAVSSGDEAFDIDALGAVECAGMNNRLGPLPEDYPFEFLPIRFTITSRVGSEDPLVRPVEGVH